MNSANEKKVEKVVDHDVVIKKRGFLDQLLEAFIPEGSTNISDFIISELIMPTFKKSMSDIVNHAANAARDVIVDGMEILLYGEARNRSKSITPRVSYNRYCTREASPFSTEYTKKARFNDGFYLDDVVVQTRGEAESVITTMEELISVYGSVSISDFYDMLDMTCPYTNFSYGWTNLRNVSIVRVSEGYLIKLPKAMPLR